MSENSHFVVITSIHEPTGAIAEWARCHPWKVIVAADQKTPPDWKLSGVELLPFTAQSDSFAQQLPINHYGRKMTGYAQAIKQGASVILDTDDDTYPDPGWKADQPFDLERATIVKSDSSWLNIHAVYGHADSWPRGFPLALLNRQSSRFAVTASDVTHVGIWQGLVSAEPDVDAVYRLTRRNRPDFVKAGLIALAPGLVSPFNSQNTLFRREVFPLLYLPCTVSFRFTDILRAVVAQPIMWAAGYSLGFGEANAMQRRNEHDLMSDFNAEIPVYTQVEKALAVVKQSIVSGNDLCSNLILAYAALERAEIVKPEENAILAAWLSAIT